MHTQWKIAYKIKNCLQNKIFHTQWKNCIHNGKIAYTRKNCKHKVAPPFPRHIFTVQNLAGPSAFLRRLIAENFKAIDALLHCVVSYSSLELAPAIDPVTRRRFGIFKRKPREMKQVCE